MRYDGARWTIERVPGPNIGDYAGLPIPEKMQGRSWKPLLDGTVSDWRRSFFYCYYYESNYRTPTMMAVRTGTDKLVKYPGHERQAGRPLRVTTRS